MTLDSLQTLVTGLLIAVGTGLGVIGRWASAGGKALRLARGRLDAAESYILTLRRQLRGRSIDPEAWPERLEYMASTVEPEGRSDDAH